MGAFAVEVRTIHATNPGEISFPSLAIYSSSNCCGRSEVSCGDREELDWPTMAPPLGLNSDDRSWVGTTGVACDVDSSIHGSD